MPAAEITVADEKLEIRQPIIGDIDLVEEKRANVEALGIDRRDESAGAADDGRDRGGVRYGTGAEWPNSTPKYPGS